MRPKEGLSNWSGLGHEPGSGRPLKGLLRGKTPHPGKNGILFPLQGVPFCAKALLSACSPSVTSAFSGTNAGLSCNFPLRPLRADAVGDPAPSLSNGSKGAKWVRCEARRLHAEVSMAFSDFLSDAPGLPTRRASKWKKITATVRGTATVTTAVGIPMASVVRCQVRRRNLSLW